MSDRPRLIMADNNIRNSGGHFFELANLLLGGARRLGYRGILATHAKFDEQLSLDPNVDLIPTFHTRRMIHWSLGVDGRSKFQRDLEGKSIGGGRIKNASINFGDRFRPKRSPTKMLNQWADDFAQLLIKLKPTAADSLLINTGDDFTLLALAAAMQRCDTPPLRIDVIFHFALYDRAQRDCRGRLYQIGRQIDSALQLLAPHQVQLHATTTNLAGQLRETACRAKIGAIPYPTRPRRIADSKQRSSDEPLKAVLAGLPRAEKGKAAIVDVLTEIEQPLLRTRRFRLSMQMPEKRWRQMIPASLQRDYLRAVSGICTEPLEIMTNNLTTSHYHDWLDTADVGLFLYHPSRYVARCSGVLLEMMVRGVPVIVPDGCWLADQVRLAGGDGSIGYIYKDRGEIAGLMKRFAADRQQISDRAMGHAATIGKRHSGKNSLLEMGLPADLGQDRQVA